MAGNHFSNTLCEKLTGERMPAWVRPPCRTSPFAVTLSWLLASRLIDPRPAWLFWGQCESNAHSITSCSYCSGRACPSRLLSRMQSTMLLQVNRLAGLAVMLHCILPSALGLPPLLATPSVTRALPAKLELGLGIQRALAVTYKARLMTSLSHSCSCRAHSSEQSGDLHLGAPVWCHDASAAAAEAMRERQTCCVGEAAVVLDRLPVCLRLGQHAMAPKMAVP